MTFMVWFDVTQICDFPLILLFVSILLRLMNAFINHTLRFTDSRDFLHIQGDSRGNINILGSDSIGRCEKKMFI